MSKIEQYLDQYNNSLKASRDAYKVGHDCFDTAKSWYDTLRMTRETELRVVLHEKGLAVCAERHYDSSEERHGIRKIEKPTAEDLGIYPRDQMKLRYVQGMWSRHSRHEPSTEFPVIEAKLLCPVHFFEKHRPLYEHEGWPDYPIIDSEMVERKGRLILLENNKDVTGMIDRLRDGTNRFVQAEIKLKGNPYPDVFVYRYFDIPDLPEEPSWDMVK